MLVQTGVAQWACKGPRERSVMGVWMGGGGHECARHRVHVGVSRAVWARRRASSLCIFLWPTAACKRGGGGGGRGSLGGAPGLT